MLPQNSCFLTTLGQHLLWGNTKSAAEYSAALCASLGIRTLDPLIKSQLLYQLS